MLSKYRLGQHVTWRNARGVDGDGVIREAYFDGERWWYAVGSDYVWVEECLICAPKQPSATPATA